MTNERRAVVVGAVTAKTQRLQSPGAPDYFGVSLDMEIAYMAGNGLPGRSQPLSLFLERRLVEELCKKLPLALEALPDN